MPSAKTGKVITAIGKKKKGRIPVSFGTETIVLSEDAFTEYPLYVGKECSESEYRRLLKLSKNNDLYVYAISLLKRGNYPKKVMREKLEARAAEGENPFQVLNRLIIEGLLDDEMYAQDYKEMKERSLYGKRRILETLRFEKGIEESILSRLKFEHEEEHAEAYVETLQKRMAGLPLGKKRAKAKEALLRRGFEYGAIEPALSSLKEDKKAVKSNLETHYLSAKRKFGAKYDGYELRQHIIASLLRKGYPYEAINEHLEEDGL